MHSRPSAVGAVLFSLAVLLITLSFFRVYYIGGFGACDLLWNQKEAYLFVHGERRGYYVSYLGYLGELAKGYFGVIDPPDDRRPFTIIIRITQSGTERYQQDQLFYYYTPFNEGLYTAHDNDAALWKWEGTHFEKVSAEEQRSLGGTDHLSRKDFTNVNGWSGLYSVESKMKEKFPILVDGLPVVVQVKGGQVSINLSPLGQPPGKQMLTEALYYGEGQPQRVSKAEYEHVFGATP